MSYLHHIKDKAIQVLDQNLMIADILIGGGKIIFIFSFWVPSFLVSARGGVF